MAAPSPSPARRPARGAAALALAGAAALALSGCASPRLVDERRQAPYAELLSRYEAAPRRREVLRVAVPGAEPTHVAVEVLAPPHAAGPVLVLQPGVLADGSTWRFLMGALAGERRMVAVDPPGTGGSGVPDPRRARPPSYSPTWLAAHTLAALEALEARTGERPSYVLVGHSLGATVVLRALADPELGLRHAGLLERVRGAVLLSPADLASEHRDPSLRELALLGDCEAGLGQVLGVMQRQVREGVRRGAVIPERDALRSEAARIEALLGRRETRHAAQAMLRRFQPAQGRLGPDLAAARRLAEEERAIRRPVLLVWGAEDRTLPRRGAEALRERLTSEEFVLLEATGHSLHQERVEDVAARLRAFVAALAEPEPTR